MNRKERRLKEIADRNKELAFASRGYTLAELKAVNKELDDLALERKQLEN